MFGYLLPTHYNRNIQGENIFIFPLYCLFSTLFYAFIIRSVQKFTEHFYNNSIGRVASCSTLVYQSSSLEQNFQ